MKKAVILFADGVEECEGLLVVDLLRRAKVEIDIVSLNKQLNVLSSHRVNVSCDALLDEVDFSNYDLLILPGGMPGTKTLSENDTVLHQVSEFYSSGRKIAAICAAPSVLAKAGILNGKRATVHPNFRDQMKDAVLTDQEVVVDGEITTAWGLGAAIPFGLELVSQLVDDETASRIKSAIGYIH